MEQLKHMKRMLMSCAEGQMTHLDSVDAKELGEVVDMIKDLEEAIYYCTITKAMEESEKKPEGRDYQRNYQEPYYRDIDRGIGRMYYTDGNSGNNGTGNYMNYREMEYPVTYMRDSREGRSGETRRSYMETKQMHKGQEAQSKELDRYLHDLSSDLIEMISDSTPEEKQTMARKLNELSTKIAQAK